MMGGRRILESRVGGASRPGWPEDRLPNSPVRTGANSGAGAGKLTEIPLVPGGSGTLARGPRTTVKQQPAITIEQEHELYTESIYVATTGKRYPIRLVKAGRETGQTTFTGWNHPVTVSAPSNAVDISQLQHLKRGR